MLGYGPYGTTTPVNKLAKGGVKFAGLWLIVLLLGHGPCNLSIYRLISERCWVMALYNSLSTGVNGSSICCWVMALYNSLSTGVKCAGL